MNHLQWVEHMKGQFKKYYSFSNMNYIFGQSVTTKVKNILSKSDQEINEKELHYLMKIELIMK